MECLVAFGWVVAACTILFIGLHLSDKRKKQREAETVEEEENTSEPQNKEEPELQSEEEWSIPVFMFTVRDQRLIGVSRLTFDPEDLTCNPEDYDDIAKHLIASVEEEWKARQERET